ncbi:hypothetical protein DFR79_106148 [Halanaerobium saccharolyticum]|jgi:hypothetical protein|uniref:Uncharacterized protein n=1 Tax=Halanaerobium saccharolyticum TaxID=43595 RepID=A0A4R6LW56_9FIRM|nr:hypothetical protein [Halanaerobium saccharolyticum]TDO92335.1 hypothetical protein DFR79_106148 [Halanaerobium saccharolyticum]
MTMGEQIEKKQPQIYNFLIDCFDLSLRKTERVEPVEFAEDDPVFASYKYMMEAKSGVKM